MGVCGLCFFMVGYVRVRKFLVYNQQMLLICALHRAPVLLGAVHME